MTQGRSLLWDARFLRLAREIAGWSKDPSTKVGSVIVRSDRTVASLGFNGFPRGVDDSVERLAERDLKYDLVVHAEMNAILHAREPLHGCILYVSPLPPCVRCAGAIVQSGIRVVVAIKPEGDLAERWKDSLARTELVLHEGGVDLYTWPAAHVDRVLAGQGAA